MAQSAAFRLGVQEEGARADEPEDEEDHLNAQDKIDYGPIHSCCQVFSVLGEKETFENYYREQRRQQIEVCTSMSATKGVGATSAPDPPVHQRLRALPERGDRLLHRRGHDHEVPAEPGDRRPQGRPVGAGLAEGQLRHERSLRKAPRGPPTASRETASTWARC